MGQRFEGKNLEEALGAASAALGVERYRLTYHVVLEKRGFLGGTKRVVIEAEINDSAAEPAAAPAVSPAPPPPYERQESRPRRERAPRDRGDDRQGREGGRRGRRGRRGEPRFEREEQADFIPADIPPQGEESEAAESVRIWIAQALRLARLDVEIRTEESDAQITVRLYGRDAQRMLDRNGELLDAIQVLANKALTGRKIEKDIELNCAEFKERRVEELGQQARQTADRVRRDGREQLLPAMSPIERRIVHLALQDDADVTTESRGDGFYKRVAIIPRPAAEAQTSES